MLIFIKLIGPVDQCAANPKATGGRSWIFKFYEGLNIQGFRGTHFCAEWAVKSPFGIGEFLHIGSIADLLVVDLRITTGIQRECQKCRENKKAGHDQDEIS